jgi:hypothetical protein
VVVVTSWVGSSWVLTLNWATYVYFLVYLEALCIFFDIYNITYQKIKLAICVSYLGTQLQVELQCPPRQNQIMIT